MTYLGDFVLGATFDLKFTTANAGVPFALAGSPVISAYPDNSTTQLTAGITLSVDFDGVTGLNNVRVVASSGNGYAAGVNYQLVITTGTVNGQSVVGYVVGQFSIAARVASLADAVWEEALADHSGTVGSTAEQLAAAGAAGDPWATALPGAYGSGTAGKIVGDNVNATISSRSSHAAADIWAVATRLLTAGTNIVLAKGTGVTGFNDLSAAQVNAEADTALSDYDPPTRAELTTDTNSILSKLLKYVQLTLRKDAAIATDNATEVTAINADGGSGAGAFANTTDAQEAIRDNMGTAQTGDSFARLGAPAGASVSADIADLPTNAELATSQAAADDATLAAIAALNNLSAAQVNAEVDTALVDIHLDHLLAVTYDPASKPGAADALLNELVESDAGVARYTANALEQAPTGGSAPTVGQIADAVWDETLADHLGAGSTGAGLNAAGSAGDPWSTALPGAYGAGSAGKIVGDNLNATVGSRATQTSVDDLPTNAELATSQAAADDATLAAIAALNNLSAAGVRTELATELGRIDVAVSTRAPESGGNLAAVKAKTDALPTDPADESLLEAAIDAAEAAILAAIPTAAANAAALLDLSNGVETSITPRQALRLILAASAGKLSGAATTTIAIRNVGDTKDRITATVDSDGNRVAVTTDVT